MNDFAKLDLVGTADAIRGGKFGAQDVTHWSLARLEELGKRYNAVFRIDPDLALARARELDDQRTRGVECGPLHGVPLAHKDIFDVSGLESHAGSVILKGRIATQTAFVIKRLDEAGQVNLGSLHMAEFALSPTGFNGHYGSGLNPWNPAHICGGSSSGSGIAVAARMIFGSLGADTAGSIRLPAAMCGVTGIKPTFRRVSVEGCFPVSYSLDSVGPIAQSARDCARLLTQISQLNPRDALCSSVAPENYEAQLTGRLDGIRIGVPQEYYREDLDDQVALALNASLDVLRKRGASIVVTHIPDLMDRVNALCQLVMSVEAATLHRKWLESRPLDYSEQVRSRIEQGFAYSAVRYVEALSVRSKVLAEYLAVGFADCDVLHVPVLPLTTPTIEQTTDGDPAEVQQMIGRVNGMTRGVNYLGLPAMSIPAGISDAGLPLGYQLIGRPFSEALLLRVADAFQQETDWHRIVPSL